MSNGPLFTTIDAEQLQGQLLELLCRTAREKGRIEITNCDGGSCILISKEELVCIERALEVLFEADGGQRIHKNLSEFLSCELVAE